MPAVMLLRRAEGGAHPCPAADGEDCIHFDCCVLPCHGKLLTQGVAHGDRGGTDDIPVLDLTQEARQINLLGAGAAWSRTFKRRSQGIRLVGSPGDRPR
jgi:hypothetical protein